MRVIRPVLLAMVALAPMLAHADTTPEAVWAALQAQTEGEGVSLSAGAQHWADALLLKAPRLVLKDGTAFSLPEATLRQLPDGTVGLELPERFTLRIDLPERKDRPRRLDVLVALAGFALTVRDPARDTLEADVYVRTAKARLVSSVPPARAGIGEFVAQIDGGAVHFTPVTGGAKGVETGTGSASLALDNVTVTQEGLLAAGWVSEKEMAIVRLLLSSLTLPGDASDSRVSAVEFRAGGAIFVNGRQLR